MTQPQEKSPKPWFSRMMFMLCCGGFVYEMYLNDWKFEDWSVNPMYGPSAQAMLDAGAKYTPYIVDDHEIWRLIAPVFLHGGVIHLGLNMFMLLRYGTAFERDYSWWRMMLLFLLCGIFATIASAVFVPEFLSVGASGSIFGLFGAFWAEYILYFVFFEKKLLSFISLFLSTAVNLAIGFTPFVDNFAHMGGFVFGFMLAYVMLTRHAAQCREMRRQYIRQTRAAMVLHAAEMQRQEALGNKVAAARSAANLRALAQVPDWSQSMHRGYSRPTLSFAAHRYPSRPAMTPQNGSPRRLGQRGTPAAAATANHRSPLNRNSGGSNYGTSDVETAGTQGVQLTNVCAPPPPRSTTPPPPFLDPVDDRAVLEALENARDVNGVSSQSASPSGSGPDGAGQESRGSTEARRPLPQVATGMTTHSSLGPVVDTRVMRELCLDEDDIDQHVDSPVSVAPNSTRHGLDAGFDSPRSVGKDTDAIPQHAELFHPGIKMNKGCCERWSLRCGTMFRSIVLFISVIGLVGLFGGGLLALFSNTDIRDWCPACDFISCIPTEWWECDAAKVDQSDSTA